MNRPEEVLQKAVVAYLDRCCPDLLFYHVPNQRGTRKRWEQGLLKAMGLKAGVPDLALVLPGGQAGFIELKAKAGRARVGQTDFHTSAVALGARVAICRTVDEVEQTLIGWGAPMRGRLA